MRKFFGKINKRRRFLFSSAILTCLVLVSSFIPYNSIWLYLVGTLFFVYGFTFFSILDGIEGIEWVTLFIIPLLFTLMSVLFYTLIPGRWITRLPFIIFYAISIYAILLSQNIFNVGVEQNLQLYRAAFSVNFLFSSILSYMSFHYALSYRFGPLLNMLILIIISSLLASHVFWSVNPKTYFSKKILLYTMYVAILIGEITYVISFLPFRTEIRALVSAGSFYSLVGLMHLHIEGKIITARIREYIIVFTVVLVLALLSARWW